jgi:hypothetical protein
MLSTATLLYADDLVFMSCDRSELELMLQTFDCVGEVGMCVKAAKDQLMAVGYDGVCQATYNCQVAMPAV